MEAVYYRTKCEQFLMNVDVIVNAKMSHKGNHIIYELDVTNRELRTLKDHYYLMEKYMREEIRGEFSRELREKDNELKTLSQANADFRSKLTNMMSLRVEEQFGDLYTKGVLNDIAPSDDKKTEERLAECHAMHKSKPISYKKQTILPLDV